MPKATIAVALLVLVALASVMTYTGFLVVGVLADLLGTGRVITGLLLGILFARLPSFSNGQFRTVGLLPKAARRPVVMGLLGLCLYVFLARGHVVPALFVGFSAAFLLAFPWLRRAIWSRVLSSVFKPFVGDPNRSKSTDDTVIDVEFREKKD